MFMIYLTFNRNQDLSLTLTRVPTLYINVGLHSQPFLFKCNFSETALILVVFVLDIRSWCHAVYNSEHRALL